MLFFFGVMLGCVFFSIVSVCIGMFGWVVVFGVGDRLLVLVLFVILNMVMVRFFGIFGWFVNYLVLV